MMTKVNKTLKHRMIKEIEHHLRHYKAYKTGIQNLQKQLEFIMPSFVASYDLVQGSNGTFSLHSKTEKYAIDRIESRKALDIHEDIRHYEIIIESIDAGLKDLSERERQFVQYRYLDEMSVAKIAGLMGYSEKHLSHIRNQVMDTLLISLKGILEVR